ncbi:hypothetical protein ACVW1A_000230 [Bradyrhizobium sp. LB1.3]
MLANTPAAQWVKGTVPTPPLIIKTRAILKDLGEALVRFHDASLY